ncbi:LOW QUALITY PROTEIN: hypothetical protein TorRG33x02_107660, partial [Trema orientale]
SNSHPSISHTGIIAAPLAPVALAVCDKEKVKIIEMGINSFRMNCSMGGTTTALRSSLWTMPTSIPPTSLEAALIAQPMVEIKALLEIGFFHQLYIYIYTHVCYSVYWFSLLLARASGGVF